MMCLSFFVSLCIPQHLATLQLGCLSHFSSGPATGLPDGDGDCVVALGIEDPSFVALVTSSRCEEDYLISVELPHAAAIYPQRSISQTQIFRFCPVRRSSTLR